MEQNPQPSGSSKVQAEQSGAMGKMTEHPLGQEVNATSANTQLNDVVKNKKEERKINEKDIEYLMSEFLLDRIKAVNILRRFDLQQAIRHCIEN